MYSSVPSLVHLAKVACGLRGPALLQTTASFPAGKGATLPARTARSKYHFSGVFSKSTEEGVASGASHLERHNARKREPACESG
jgi:hypothetical protein